MVPETHREGLGLGICPNVHPEELALYSCSWH